MTNVWDIAETAEPATDACEIRQMIKAKLTDYQLLLMFWAGSCHSLSQLLSLLGYHPQRRRCHCYLRNKDQMQLNQQLNYLSPQLLTRSMLKIKAPSSSWSYKTVRTNMPESATGGFEIGLVLELIVGWLTMPIDAVEKELNNVYSQTQPEASLSVGNLDTQLILKIKLQQIVQCKDSVRKTHLLSLLAKSRNTMCFWSY